MEKEKHSVFFYFSLAFYSFYDFLPRGFGVDSLEWWLLFDGDLTGDEERALDVFGFYLAPFSVFCYFLVVVDLLRSLDSSRERFLLSSLSCYSFFAGWDFFGGILI